ncbi:hypothetical protein HAX54_044571 [Datura stramonium]|uniref:Uncharacterized protein n=1 Tax=Datura stramonium TaxID=4076 RepID=A0ABS8SQR8_DATST|nr:hypothetical protein [Datura stramonium]
MAASVAVVNGHSGRSEKLKSDVADVRLFSGFLAGSSDLLTGSGKYCCEKKRNKQTDESLRQGGGNVCSALRKESICRRKEVVEEFNGASTHQRELEKSWDEAFEA